MLGNVSVIGASAGRGVSSAGAAVAGAAGVPGVLGAADPVGPAATPTCGVAGLGPSWPLPVVGFGSSLGDIVVQMSITPSARATAINSRFPWSCIKAPDSGTYGARRNEVRGHSRRE